LKQILQCWKLQCLVNYTQRN